jgi:hypothetical protein
MEERLVSELSGTAFLSRWNDDKTRDELESDDDSLNDQKFKLYAHSHSDDDNS